MKSSVLKSTTGNLNFDVLSNFKDYLYPEGDVYRLDELLDCARLLLKLLESEIEKNKDKNIFWGKKRKWK